MQKNNNLLDTVRSVRLGPVAAFDFLGTVGIGVFAAEYFDWPKVPTLLGLFGVGIATHAVIGQRTPLNDLVLQRAEPDELVGK